MAANEVNANASAGHKLGQLIGDWFEEYFVLPLLTGVADGLRLYLDHRFRARSARGEKILWATKKGIRWTTTLSWSLEVRTMQWGFPWRSSSAFGGEARGIPKTKPVTTAASWPP